MMTLDQHLPGATATGGGGGTLLASLWTRATDWARTCADYYAASAIYEQLSSLSNSELRRRGLSRDTLCPRRRRRVRARRVSLTASFGPKTMAAKTRRARRDDPMREIDLILLEDVMQRRNFDAGRNARTVQIGGLMVVLLGLVAVFAHALVQDQRAATAAAGNKPDPAHYANIGPPTPIW